VVGGRWGGGILSDAEAWFWVGFFGRDADGRRMGLWSGARRVWGWDYGSCCRAREIRNGPLASRGFWSARA
jgi:hypothetical protein